MTKHESAFTAEPPSPHDAHVFNLNPHTLIELALISNRAPLTT